MTGTAAEIIQYLFDQDKTKRWDLKEHREKRSLDANAYFYLLVNEIAKKQNISDVEVHDRLLTENPEYFKNDEGGFDWKVSPIEPNKYNLIKEQVNGNFEYYLNSGTVVSLEKEDGKKVEFKDGSGIVTGRVFWHIKGSRQMNSKEMSRLISSAVFEAEQLGIQTMTPNEIAQLNALWGKKHG